jgi:2'-5' RNA ligase
MGLFQTFLENKAPHSHACLMFKVPEDIAKQVLDFGKTIPEKEIYTDPDDPQYGREKECHVTVLYGFDDVSVKDVTHLLKDVKPFKVKFGKITFFESEKYDVLKINVYGIKLFDLNKLIATSIEHENKHGLYKPHCTIAYLKKGYKDKYLGEQFSGLKFDVNELYISKEDGDKVNIGLANG